MFLYKTVDYFAKIKEALRVAAAPPAYSSRSSHGDNTRSEKKCFPLGSSLSLTYLEPGDPIYVGSSVLSNARCWELVAEAPEPYQVVVNLVQVYALSMRGQLVTDNTILSNAVVPSEDYKLLFEWILTR